LPPFSLDAASFSALASAFIFSLCARSDCTLDRQMGPNSAPARCPYSRGSPSSKVPRCRAQARIRRTSSRSLAADFGAFNGLACRRGKWKKRSEVIRAPAQVGAKPPPFKSKQTLPPSLLHEMEVRTRERARNPVSGVHDHESGNEAARSTAQYNSPWHSDCGFVRGKHKARNCGLARSTGCRDPRPLDGAHTRNRGCREPDTDEASAAAATKCASRLRNYFGVCGDFGPIIDVVIYSAPEDVRFR
jgi:hypothetical protein